VTTGKKEKKRKEKKGASTIITNLLMKSVWPTLSHINDF
jgi:hypothetical protein